MIKRADVLEKIKYLIVQQLGIAPDSIDNDSTLDSLGADSLDRFEIIIKMEEEFSLIISDDDAEKINSVDQAVDYVLKHTEKQA